MNVDDVVAEKIAAAARRAEAAKRRRAAFAAARKRGLAIRHAAKLRHQGRNAAFCDGCNGTAPTYQQIAHDPWCSTTQRPNKETP
ncbi:hypothetical protein ACFWP5_25210 [Streptomyces sp. NPDC058469]|uniref:hypothetical protein n=1 Tax=Streptomyces sp. NPDC058469 TaxID=3346514 RepID=UPI0036653292